jgi:hypothetical protein
MPIIGSKSKRKQSQQLNRILQKMTDMQLVFNYFANAQWIYQSNSADLILATMTPQDKIDFVFDVRNIDWPKQIWLFCFGLRRFFAKEDIVHPSTNYKQLLYKNHVPLAHDLRTAFNSKVSHYKTNVGYFKDVLLPHKFQDFLHQQKTHEQLPSFDERAAKT